MEAASSESFCLTRYKPGSLRELWTIVWPLMLSGISGTIMVFTDRAILAGYSSEAFNACSAAQPWFWTFDGALMALIACAEVIIGRLNGAQRYKEIGPAVWQMVTLAFATYLILIPVALNAHYLLADTIEALGEPYLRMLLMTLPFEFAGFGAVGAFFVGRGDTRKIPVVVMTSCFLNCVLDYWFVFGGLGVPSLGIRGAALGTNISAVFSFFVFLVLFLRKKYRSYYAIHTYRWSWNVVRQCLKIGFPSTIAYACSNSGWALAYQFFALNLIPEHYKAYCVAFLIYNLMFCVTDGLGKATGTLCANFLGANQRLYLSSVLRQGVRLVMMFVVGFIIFLLLFSHPLIGFLGSKEFASNTVFFKQTNLFLTWYVGVFACDALRYCVNGFLFSLLKAKVILTANVILYWGVCLLPTYLTVTYWHWNPVIYAQMLVLNQVIALVGFYIWYKRGTWKRE